MLLDDYRQRWVTWVYSGIPLSIIDFDGGTNVLRLFLKTT
jgi:RNA-directed DNA polymerase